MIPTELRRLVSERAAHRCEYCFLSDGLSFFRHHVDHIRARKHSGSTEAGNLALACPACNLAKGSDLGSFDPETDEFEFFFNPRTHVWRERFQLQNAEIIAATAIGRTTARIFQFNTLDKLLERTELMRFDLYSVPKD